MNPGRLQAPWRWFFAVAALEAGAALLVLRGIPSEGLSAARLGMLATLAASGLAAGYLALRPPLMLGGLVRPPLILATAMLAVVLGTSLFLLRYADPARLLPLYQRLSPLLIFLLLLCLQGFFFLLALRNGLHPALLASRRPQLRYALAVFGLLLVVAVFIAVTRLGLTPDPAYWGEPGVPIQGWQFGLALVLGAAAFHFARGTTRSPGRFLLPALIYVCAVVIWLSVPLEVLKNSFYVSIDPPFYEPYPYSDAGYYDSMAQSLLIGHPYQGEIPTRPLYIVLLAFLHVLFGQRYDLLIAGQTLVLALIPVLLYLLGTRVHSRTAGVTAALFFIFREWTTLLVSSETRVSNTKTLLVDLPTLLLLLLSCLLVLRWLERRGPGEALAAGGSLGLLLLLRTQSLSLLPFVLLLAALVMGQRGRGFMVQGGLLLLGMGIAIAPWLLHNYLLTGRIAMDAGFQYKLLASQYAYTGNLDSRNFDFQGKGLGQILLQFLLQDPGFILGFVSNHFLAGWVGGLLALPLFQTYPGLFEPIHLYWMEWDGQLAWYNAALIVVYLAIISIGLSAAWRRLRWLGMIPLVFNVGYTLATAIGRFSGWRYDLPADWVPYFYFAVGFAEILSLAALFLGREVPGEAEQQPADGGARSGGAGRLLAIAACIALAGALPWVATAFASPRYADQSTAALIEKLSGLPEAPDAAEVQAFLSQPDAVFMEGRVLYPRYFYRGAGISSTHPWPSYAARDFPRQGFLLLNGTLADIVFPTTDMLDFRQGSDVLVLGCQSEDFVQARLVGFPERGTLFAAEPLSTPCE